jgi:hypothetical protein
VVQKLKQNFYHSVTHLRPHQSPLHFFPMNNFASSVRSVKQNMILCLNSIQLLTCKILNFFINHIFLFKINTHNTLNTLYSSPVASYMFRLFLHNLQRENCVTCSKTTSFLQCFYIAFAIKCKKLLIYVKTLQKWILVCIGQSINTTECHKMTIIIC